MARKGQLLQQSQTLLRLNGNESSIQNASTPVNVTVPVKNYSTENNNANVNATLRRALEADHAARSNDIIQSSSSQQQLHQEEASVELLNKPLKKFKGHASPITNIATIDAHRFLSLSWDKTIRLCDVTTVPITVALITCCIVVG